MASLRLTQCQVEDLRNRALASPMSMRDYLCLLSASVAFLRGDHLTSASILRKPFLGNHSNAEVKNDFPQSINMVLSDRDIQLRILHTHSY